MNINEMGAQRAADTQALLHKMTGQVAQVAAPEPPELDRHWCQVLLACWDNDRTMIRPGGFETRLMDLFEVADGGNRAKIAKGYPEVMEVVETWNHVKGGATLVRARAHSPYVMRPIQ